MGLPLTRVTTSPACRSTPAKRASPGKKLTTRQPWKRPRAEARLGLHVLQEVAGRRVEHLGQLGARDGVRAPATAASGDAARRLLVDGGLPARARVRDR